MINCESYYADAINTPHLYLPLSIKNMAQEVEKGEASRLNYLWIYPINLGACVIGIFLAPISFMINMLTAAVFACYSCCSNDAVESARTFAVNAFSQLLDIPLYLFISIFNPSLNIATPVKDCLYNCYSRIN